MKNNNNLKIGVKFFLIIAIVIIITSLILNSKIDFSYPAKKMLIYAGFDLNKHKNIEINNFCSGLFSIALFLAIVFSPISKGSLKKKFFLGIVFSIILFFLNVLRLALILYFSNFINPNTIHIIGWFFMGFSIYIIWVLFFA